ncbi:MAG: glycosyltransferase family 2 protein, partial [Candidatus Omnitrophota bacterium]
MISVVIPNWNGREYLEKCLPSLYASLSEVNSNYEVIVVDNASTDASTDYIRDNFQSVRLISFKSNLGFSRAMNTGIKEAKGDIIIGLNNDIVVAGGCIHYLASHFDSADGIFSVAAKMYLLDRITLNFSRASAQFKFGFFRRVFTDSASSCNALYACGGAFAVDKNKFLELGGFDEELTPFWEDMDICYRAWKRGYRTIYEPKAVVYHKFHGSFLKKYSEAAIHKLSGENYFLFCLKNFHQKKFFFRFILTLPVLIISSLILGKHYFALGLIKSLRKWPLFWRKRSREIKLSRLCDKEV